MRFLLLNQFGPASDAPTGRILSQLGSELEQHGHEVYLVTSDSRYGKLRRGWRRILHEGLSHLRLLGRSLCCPKVDIVISLTSPVCLPITAGIISRVHQASHFHWAMDIYPEVGLRLGELSNSPAVRFLRILMHRAYQKAQKVICLDEDMRDYLQKHYGVTSTIIEPFPPDVYWPPSMHKSPNLIGQWLYSGNFGRAHEIQILLDIQKKLEDRQVKARLILQGQGPQFLSSRTTAAQLGLQHVEWRNPLPLGQLGESLVTSDIVVVTRKAEMKGLLLPSKLMLAELSGRTILWIGDTDGKTAQRLSQNGRHGVFTINDTEAISIWLQARFERRYLMPMTEPISPQIIRQQSIRQWETLLLG